MFRLLTFGRDNLANKLTLMKVMLPVIPRILFFIMLLPMVSRLAAMVSDGVRDSETIYSVRYVRENGASVRDTSAFSAPETEKLLPLTRVLVADQGSDWVQLLYPLKGWVNRYFLYSEREYELLYFDEKKKENDFSLLASDKTPMQDILDNPRGLLPFDPDRNWQPDPNFKVRMVSASTLNLRFLPGTLSDTIAQFRQGDKLIVDRFYDGAGEWERVVFPEYGFVHSAYLYSDADEVRLLKEQQMKNMRLLDAVLRTSVLPPENRKELKLLSNKSGYSEIVKHEDQSFVVRENRQMIPDSVVSIGWSEPVDLNLNQYPGELTLQLNVNDRVSAHGYRARILCRGEDDDDFKPLTFKKNPPFKPLENATWVIKARKHHLAKGKYDLRLEIFDAETRDLLSVQSPLLREELQSVLFEDEVSNRMQFSIMATVSPWYRPVETVFKAHGIPLGFQAEMSRETWKLAPGIGYNMMHALSASGAFELQSGNLFAYLKYIPFRFFDERLDLFVMGGLTSWSSRISNVRYPDHVDYYPTETTRGFNGTFGVGTLFHLGKWMLGVQGQIFNTSLATFGGPLNEPETQEELNTWIPTNQYKLYPGSNQLQVLIGFRF